MGWRTKRWVNVSASLSDSALTATESSNNSTTWAIATHQKPSLRRNVGADSPADGCVPRYSASQEGSLHAEGGIQTYSSRPYDSVARLGSGCTSSGRARAASVPSAPWRPDHSNRKPAQGESRMPMVD